MSTMSLTNDQISALSQFSSLYKSQMNSSIHGMILNKAMFLRYLHARNYNIDKAKKMLDSTIEWRNLFKLYEIDTKWVPIVKHENCTGKVYVRGFDKKSINQPNNSL